MNWIEVLCAGLGGGIGGAMGGLAAALLFKGSAKNGSAIALVLAIVGGRLGAEVGKSEALAELLHPSTRLERAARKVGQQLEADPTTKARFQGLDATQARQLGQELAHRGLKRLPAEELQRWNELRVRLSHSSPAACAGFWTGGLDGNQLTQALEGLPDADLEAWLEISTHATRLEAAGGPAPAQPADALPHGFQLVMAKLSEADRSRFALDLSRGTQLDAPEACWAATTLLEQAQALAPADRVPLLRGLAAL
jgi:hypothetical protein